MVASHSGPPAPPKLAMVAGMSSSELAKIGGITPDTLSLSGRCELSPPNMRLPCWRLGYCTRMRRWARSMNTMKVITATTMNSRKMISMVESAPVRPSSSVLASALRQLRDDAGEDDQRDAVADAARRDLLAQPHQEQRAADDGDHRADAEMPAGIEHRAAARSGHRLQADRQAVALEGGEEHRQVAGVLIDLLAPGLAFFLQLLDGRRHRGHQLHDDRGRDVGQDAEREDRHPLQRAAGEHVEHAHDAAGVLLEDLRHDHRVDARQRDVGAEAIDDQAAEREPEPLLELRRLAERAEIDVGGQLLGHRCHGRPPLFLGRLVGSGPGSSRQAAPQRLSGSSGLAGRQQLRRSLLPAAPACLRPSRPPRSRLCDALSTSIVSATLSSPRASSRIPSRRLDTRPAARRACRLTGCAGSSRPASTAACSRSRLTGTYSLRNRLVKPRLGRRR